MRLLAIPAVFAFAALFLVPDCFRSRAADDPNIAKTQPRTPAEEQKGFHVPDGFAVELVAAEPAIHKPINLNFDAKGRLWVTESVEYPFQASKDRKPRDAVKMIESTKNDGVFDKVTTFADELNIPIGVLPVKDGAIVYTIPNIVHLIDSDGSGKADKRETVYGLMFTPDGRPRDTHGMTGSFTWGFDGWVYAHHGFSNTSTIKATDGSSITLNSGNTYRFKVDGARVEQFTWGQVNPFGMAFDPLGNLFSADCHTKPIMQLLRGGYYDSFGKPHDGLGYTPEICGNYPDSTAVCGIAIYAAAADFPAAFRDTAFIGDVVTNHIVHYRFENHGSTRKAVRLPDFLKSDDPWFRPVDIKLGPDGALYVADFYNRIIGHYEVPLDHPGRDRERGRIWRIVYRGTDQDKPIKPVMPRADWTKATPEELVKDLGHPNLTVRTIATNQLVERGPEQSLEALRKLMATRVEPFQRVHAMWALERLGSLDLEALAFRIRDEDPMVRTHAMRVLAERKSLTPAQRLALQSALRDADAFVQRAAVDALGQHVSTENIRPLLDLRHVVPKDDTLLLHDVRIALRNQLRTAESWQHLPQPLTEADARAIADVAPGVHSAEAGAYLVKHIQKLPEPGPSLTRYLHHAARYAAPALQTELVAFALKDHPDDLRHQAGLFRAIQQGTQERGAPLAAEARKWADDLTGKLLASPQNDLQSRGIELAGALKLASAQEPLLAIATRRELKEDQRRAAAAALVAIDPKAHIVFLAKLVTEAGEPAGLRDQVATMLAGINQPESRAELIKALPTAPARLQSAIATGMAGTPQGVEQLLEAITAGKASARLLLEKPVELRLSQSKVPNLKERVAKLTKGLPAADEKLNELIKKRRAGFLAVKSSDLEAGAKVYEKTCANCHALGGKGAKVGPQLDGIGNRGLDRLLEDILDPNRNVDQQFRATTLSLKNGQIVMGLVLREEGEIVIVADQQGKEVRVPKDQIDERVVSQLSPMPANLADQIPEADFYHLLAYLLAQRPTKPE
jgi:putative heme-binding domain-containing protein